MTGLVEWLTAQLDADEKGAEMTWRRLTGRPWTGESPHPTERDEEHDLAAMAAARRLRTIAAHRAILGLHEYSVSEYGGRRSPDAPLEQVRVEYCECQCAAGVIGDTWPCLTLRLLAAIYQDRDGFDPSWKVET